MEAAAVPAPVTDAQLAPVSAEADLRHPVVVVFATLVTLGLYSIWWWHAANRDLANIGRARGTRALGDKPWLSALAFAGGLVTVFVSTAVTAVTTGLRLRRAGRLAGQEPLKLWLYLLLGLLTFGLGAMYYAQQQLNAVVRAHLGLSEDEARERLRAKRTRSRDSHFDHWDRSSSWNDGPGGPGFSSFD